MVLVFESFGSYRRSLIRTASRLPFTRGGFCHHKKATAPFPESSTITPGESRWPQELVQDTKSCNAFTRWRTGAGWSNVNDSGKKSIAKSDSSPLRDIGSQKAYRRDLRQGRNPVYFYFRKGERGRDYKEHPYWFGVGSTKAHL
jgi:hypothetical protein